MVSLSLAWVIVTIVKHTPAEFELSPAMFIITGVIDFGIACAIGYALS